MLPESQNATMSDGVYRCSKISFIDQWETVADCSVPWACRIQCKFWD